MMRRSVGISIHGVNASYGTQRVLKDISLEIQPGEFFAFLGPSGCGKTTLLRVIAGFNSVESGEVRIGAQDVLGLPPWKRDVGMVFQSYALWPHMTVARNVAFGLEERRLARAEIDKRVAAALEMVGLADLAHRRPSQLSGGQQQRVALARTIAIEPKVLLLDEPLSNLDAKLRIQVRRELRDLQQRLGLTTIFVTHDQEEANTICDRIAVLREGAVQQVGTPMELYERPANLFVANFLGTANILDGRVIAENGRSWFEIAADARVPVQNGAAVMPGAKLVFRPQHAVVTAPGSAGPAPLRGTVRHREFLGGIVRYAIQIGPAEICVDTSFHSGERLFPVGTSVEVMLPDRAIQWLAT